MLLPWDDPGTLSEVGVTSRHLSAAEGGCLDLLGVSWAGGWGGLIVFD